MDLQTYSQAETVGMWLGPAEEVQATWPHLPILHHVEMKIEIENQWLGMHSESRQTVTL